MASVKQDIATIEAYVQLQVQGPAASSGNSLHCYLSSLFSLLWLLVFVLFILVSRPIAKHV